MAFIITILMIYWQYHHQNHQNVHHRHDDDQVWHSGCHDALPHPPLHRLQGQRQLEGDPVEWGGMLMLNHQGGLKRGGMFKVWTSNCIVVQDMLQNAMLDYSQHKISPQYDILYVRLPYCLALVSCASTQLKTLDFVSPLPVSFTFSLLGPSHFTSWKVSIPIA